MIASLLNVIHGPTHFYFMDENTEAQTDPSNLSKVISKARYNPRWSGSIFPTHHTMVPLYLQRNITQRSQLMREHQRYRQLSHKTNIGKCQQDHISGWISGLFQLCQMFLSFFQNKTLGMQEVPRISLPAQNGVAIKRRYVTPGWKNSPFACPCA